MCKHANTVGSEKKNSRAETEVSIEMICREQDLFVAAQRRRSVLEGTIQ